MSAVAGWLAGRRPTPPSSLRPWLSTDLGGGTLSETLAAEACAHMRNASARLGPVRESALHLLAADALMTYACEAALEADDPAAALSATLRALGSPPGTHG